MVNEMLTAIGIILSLVFVGWLIWRAAKKRPLKAHMVMYGLSCLTGVFTIAFFWDMNISKILKILICIMLGGMLIYFAARSQQSTEENQD